MHIKLRLFILVFITFSLNACQAIKEELRQEDIALVNLTLQQGVIATDPNIISPNQEVYGLMTPQALDEDSGIVYSPEHGTETIILLPKARKISQIVVKFQRGSRPKSYSLCYCKENEYAWTQFRMQERVPPNGISILKLSPVITANRIRIRAAYLLEHPWERRVKSPALKVEIWGPKEVGDKFDNQTSEKVIKPDGGREKATKRSHPCSLSSAVYSVNGHIEDLPLPDSLSITP